MIYLPGLCHSDTPQPVFVQFSLSHFSQRRMLSHFAKFSNNFLTFLSALRVHLYVDKKRQDLF